MPAEEAPPKIEFKPRGRAVQVAESDSSQIDAIRDAIDNVIDATKVNADEGGHVPDKVTVRIEYYPGKSEADERIVIKDNGAQGVRPDELGDVLALGASSKGRDLIGEFGIGGLRYFALGDTVHVGSNHPNYPASEFTASAPKLRADDTGDADVFEADRRDIDDLPEGWFRVVIEDLKSGIDGLIQSAIDDIGMDVEGDDGDTDVAQRLVDETALNPVKEALGRTYYRYLDGGIQVAGKDEKVPFEIVLLHGRAETDDEEEEAEEENEITVKPVSPPGLVRLPTDGLGPRKYEEVPFATSPEEDPEPEIYADVEVGLQKDSDEEMAGLYLAFQDRMILYADLQSRLFDSSYLGSLNDASGQTRLIIKVDIREAETEDDNRSYLPINSAKTGFDYNNYATDRLLNFISNTADPYKNQVYQRLRNWFLSSFAPEANPTIDESKLPEKFTKSKKNSKTNKAAANPKPGHYASGKRLRDYPERDVLQTIIVGHDLLQIRVDQPAEYLRKQFNALASENVRSNISSISSEKAQQFAFAYEYYFAHEYPKTGDTDDGIVVPDSPVEIPWDAGPDTTNWTWIREEKRPYELEQRKETPDFINQITELAVQHTNKGGRADHTATVADWQKPQYLLELRRRTCKKQTTDAGKPVLEIGEYLDLEIWDVKTDTPEESEDEAIANESSAEDDSSSQTETQPNEDSSEQAEAGSSGRGQQKKITSQRTENSHQPEKQTESTESTEPSTQQPQPTSDVDEGIILVTNDGQTTVKQTPPEKGFIILDNEPRVIGEEQYEAIQKQLAELGHDGDDILANIDAALERLEELEGAAAVFKN